MPASYPLEPLLTVRHFRENAAQNALRRAERAVREAENLIVQRQRELEEYRIWRLEEEERRYTEIMGQEITMPELDKFRAGLAALANEEQGKILAVEQARVELEKCQAAVEQARQAVKTAQRETAKIVAHKDIWKAEAKKEAERQEDLETEEFKPRSINTEEDE
ncbi:MAG: type III secretion protein [bacterium]|jgi:type III secretion protein O|nr:type III secretion protein [bacterium]